ncbi:MAG TPA: TonB-dependent receptor [Candidatus Angelobacter sp.]
MNRKLRDKLILVATCLMMLCSIPSFGQVLKGSISGTAVDQNGAVVPGAQVKATGTGTGSVLTTTTDNSGLFRFSLIPAGEYKVQITAQNFKTTDTTVVVTSGRDSGLGTIKLAVGSASTTVEVTADAPLIETSQAQVTNTFSGVALSTFAGIQENQGLDNLAVFVPGVSSSRDNNFSNSNGGGGFSSNGLRGRNNDQEIDGQNNNDNSVGGPGLFVSDVEFVGQYVLITNQFGPEYGRNSGSVVNIVTKSGSNAWHGSVYGSENSNILNSLDNLDKDPDVCGDACLTKPNRVNDEFGGFTIGGPVMKNKVFFFGGFDQEIVSQANTFSSGTLTPTPAGLATIAGCGGNAAALSAITTFGAFGISAGNPTAFNQQTGVMANCPDAEFAQVQRTVAQPIHNFNWVLKNDIQLGNDTITARYLFNRGNSFNNGDNGSAGYFFNVPALSQATLVSWTHNLSSHMVNEARVSFGRLNVGFGGNSFGTEPTAANLDQALTNVSFANGSDGLGFGPATNLPQARIVNTWQAQDNWNYVHGKHQLKAGVNWTYQRSPNTFLPNINGAFQYANFDNFFCAGGAPGTCAGGNAPSTISIAQGPSSLDFREYDTFLYGGDDWKISQNLTVQLGLTWSYYGQPANLLNQITTAQQTGPNPFWNPALPLSVTTLPTITAPKNSFGPSVGFVYSPHFGGFLTGNGKTTFRGGYRMLYDPPFYNIYLNVATSTPEVISQTLANPALSLPAVPTGPNVRSLLASSLVTGVNDPRSFNQTNINPNFGPDKVHTWSLGLEREISKNTALELRYVGNHGEDLFQTENANPFIANLATDFPNLVPAGLTPCPAASAAIPRAVGRINCNEGILRTRANTGFSNYNALQSEFRANNLFKQLTIRASYTYQKTLDNVSEIFSTFAGGNSSFIYQNPSNPNGPGEYSFSGLDVPQQFSLLFTEQLPFFKEQHGLVGHVLGGWTVAANYLMASGQRYTPTQFFLARVAVPNYFDSAFTNAFNSGAESARPFLGNLSAPSTAVGIFAGDACNLLDGGAAPTCALPANTLISFTALGSNCLNHAVACTVVPVTNQQVRYIVNSATSESIFGTPFGNMPRNPAQDAMQNIANASIFKDVKLGEHATFEFRTTFLNAFNHPNFSSVDPIIEDAGITGAFTGFGNPTTSQSTTRRIIFGGKLTF